MKFSSEELNAARQNLFNEVVEYFFSKEGVEALYIQGSVAAGSADEFSDIDFRVVIQPKFYEQYISERFSAPQNWGEWLFKTVFPVRVLVHHLTLSSVVVKH